MTHDALYWKQINGKVKCLLCPHACIMSELQAGLCKTRKNVNGKLVTLAYGNPVAINIDPIEKKPLYHFYPGSKTYSFATNGCNLKCLNCQNHSISQFPPANNEISGYLPSEIVKKAAENKSLSISYTYTEPVVFYEYVTNTSILARNAGIKNIIVSSGYISQKPLKEWCKWIDAANIDLKCFDNSVSLKLNGIRLSPVLKSLVDLKKAGIWLEITNLIIPGWTDSVVMLQNMCKWLAENGFENTPLHFSRFFPSYKLNMVQPTPINTLIMAYDIAKTAGLKFVYLGNVNTMDSSNTFCPKCKQDVIKRDGYNVLEINLNKNKCINCQTEIPGWF